MENFWIFYEKWELLLIFILGFILGIVLIWYLFSKLFSSYLKEKSKDDDVNSLQFERDSGSDKSNLLISYRRNLANFLILKNPDNFLYLHLDILEKLQEMDSWTKKTIDAQYHILSQKYKFFTDFGIGDKEYILCSDSFSYNTDKELEEIYKDNLIFHHLNYLIKNKDGLSYWEEIPRNEDYIKLLKKYVKKIKNTIFHQKLELAYSEFCNFNRITSEIDIDLESENLYETNWFFVTIIPMRDPSIEYAFTFTETKEYGIVSTFAGDDKNYKSYYRTNMNFEDKEHLDIISTEQFLLFNPLK